MTWAWPLPGRRQTWGLWVSGKGQLTAGLQGLYPEIMLAGSAVTTFAPKSF